MLYSQQGELQKSREWFEEARRGGAALALGMVYMQQGDLQEAEEFFEEARRNK